MFSKKCLSLILALMLLLCAAVPALSAHAANSVTVTLLFADGQSVTPFFDLSVADGTAEAYGIAVSEKDPAGKPVETASALDALVAAHAALYGDAFTEQTAETYLTVAWGFASKAFGKSVSFGFALNDATPHDDVLVSSEWGSFYTGYAMDTARIQDGDVITLYSYSDAAAWSDLYPTFSEKTYSAETGKPLTVHADGYSIMANGCCEQSVIDAATIPMTGAELSMTQDFKTFSSVGSLDQNGNASVCLNNPGEWYLVLRGSVNGTPVIPNISKLTVTGDPVNPTQNAALAVPADAKVNYKSTVIIIADANGVPEGLLLALYDGETQLVTGTNNTLICNVGKLKESKTYTVKIVDADNIVQKDGSGKDLSASFTVTVKNNLFHKLFWFIVRLFNWRDIPVILHP